MPPITTHYHPLSCLIIHYHRCTLHYKTLQNSTKHTDITGSSSGEPPRSEHRFRAPSGATTRLEGGCRGWRTPALSSSKGQRTRPRRESATPRSPCQTRLRSTPTPALTTIFYGPHKGNRPVKRRGSMLFVLSASETRRQRCWMLEGRGSGSSFEFSEDSRKNVGIGTHAKMVEVGGSVFIDRLKALQRRSSTRTSAGKVTGCPPACFVPDRKYSYSIY